ncbi:hypothetical protein QEG73_01070 [Chitinophagaceae bacterium 26-R-25]|nr:hypothetical protein [Chitinophagaceae bacterium 26-R-25]
MSNHSFETIQQCITEINSLDLSKISIEDVDQRIRKLMNGYKVLAFQLNPGIVLYRGILYTSKPECYSDIIYPPEHLARLNRANLKGEQMLYASSSKKAVFYELNVQVGDTLVLSTWLTNAYLVFQHVGFTKSSLERLGCSAIGGRSIEAEKEEDKLVSNFLSENFCKKILATDDSHYLITNAIARIHMQQNDFAGIFYPTIKLNGDDDNFAIKKSVVDAKLLTLDRTEFIEITQIKGDKYQYRIIDVANELIDSKIKWLSPKKSWMLSDDSKDIFYSDDFGEVIAYDENGEPVDPIC